MILQEPIQRQNIKSDSNWIKSASKRPLSVFNADPGKIQQALTKRVENITWVGIELNGTALHMKVVEKNEPDKENISVRGTSSRQKGDHLEMFVEKASRSSR
ncbi:sporulation protein YqfD [Bacillus licheniformis]|nr:sporulation protein YqfD [Bacillus licheniformis]